MLEAFTFTNESERLSEETFVAFISFHAQFRKCLAATASQLMMFGLRVGSLMIAQKTRA